MTNTPENPVAPNENVNEAVQATIPAMQAEFVNPVGSQPTMGSLPAMGAQPATGTQPAIGIQPAMGAQPQAGYPIVEAIAPNHDDEAEVQLALKNLEERRKRSKRKRIIKIVIVCAIIAAVIAAWSIANAINAQKQKEEAEAAAAQAAMTATEAPASGIQASGTLKPGSSAVVTPEVSGIIQEVRVTEGQHVNMGDVLFTLKSDEAEKAIADAQTAVDKAQRNVSKAQSDVSRAQQDYDNAVSSYNSSVDAYNNSLSAASDAAQAAYDKTYRQAVAAIPSSATSAERAALLEEAEAKADMAYDEAYQSAVAADPGSFDDSMYTAGIDAANDSVASAQEALADAEKEYARAQELMDKCLVKAPRSGTVLSLKAVVGASVGGASGGSSSTTEATVLIGDLSSLEVDIEVNEIDVSGVSVGQTAEVTFPAFPDILESAEVVSVAAAATDASSEAGTTGGTGGGIVTFTVKLVIKNPDERLKAGMSANVKIETDGNAASANSVSAFVDSGAQSATSASASGSAS